MQGERALGAVRKGRSGARTPEAQSKELQPEGAQEGSTTPRQTDLQPHGAVQPSRSKEFCWRRAIARVLRPPLVPPACLPQPGPALLRASGWADIVSPPSPLRRGPVSAREPARFIHCTSTFPTGIISIKPSALPSSLGPHPLGRLRHCSTCEPGRADAAALPSPADAAGGSDTLPKRCLSPPKGRQLPPKIKAISLPLREDAASPAASKGGLGGEEVLATAAALVQKRSPTCQVWMSFGSDTPHGRRSAGFNGLFISVSAF